MKRHRSITDIIRRPRTGEVRRAKFAYFRDGSLWYEIKFAKNDVFLFEIPAEDTGSATFKADESALTLMRWIREQVVANVAARRAQSEEG